MDELTFADLAVLERIDETTVVEKFSTKINSTFFDAANLLGTLKQKGYIDIRSQFPGPSQVILTDKGKGVLMLAKEKGAQEIEKLDEVMLSLIANGFKEPKALSDKLNLRSSDVAFHLQRLVMQDYASYDFRSGRLTLSLTDTGFKRAGYAPIGTDEERKESEQEVIEVIEGRKPAAVPSAEGGTPGAPVRLDKDARMKAKAEYYAKDLVKYAAIAVAVLIIAAAAAYYFLFMR